MGKESSFGLSDSLRPLVFPALLCSRRTSGPVFNASARKDFSTSLTEPW